MVAYVIILGMMIQSQLILRDMRCQVAPISDVNAYEVIIHHEKDTPTIVIEAQFYAVKNHPLAKDIIQTSVAFWNSQTFWYNFEAGKAPYKVCFNLREAKGQYVNSFFFPSDYMNCGEAIPVEIVPDTVMNKYFSSKEGRVLGYSPRNRVFIRESYASNLNVGLHEIGHRLGAIHHHHGRIMNAEFNRVHPEVTVETIKGILRAIGVTFEKKFHNNMAKFSSPCAIQHLGAEIPRGFFVGKKIKKFG